MTRIVAVGQFTDVDAQPLREMGAEIVDDVRDAPTDGVTALAWKGHGPVDGALMDRFPELGLIANYGVGYDSIDVEAASARGIAVTNTPDVLNDDVADLAVAMLLMQGRRMLQGHAHAQGGWGGKGEFPLNRKLSGSRAGILGLGRIGHEIADRLAAFKMEIHYWSRKAKDTPAGWTFHDDPVALARAVDILVVSTVGGAATEGIVSAEVLDALGPDGIVINISRGTTIDEDALLDRLEDGRLAGAGLDVFRGEPDIDPRFSALDNVVLQPHQGSGTHATRAAMGRLQRDNVSAFLAGKPLLTQVN